MSNFLSKMVYDRQFTWNGNCQNFTYYIKCTKYTIKRHEHSVPYRNYRNGKKVLIRIKEWNIIHPLVGVEFMAGGLEECHESCAYNFRKLLSAGPLAIIFSSVL